MERGDRSRTMILCLHDFADFWFGWRNQLLELGDRQTCEPCLTMFVREVTLIVVAFTHYTLSARRRH